VQPDVLAVTQAFAQAGKPIGLICIAPALAAKIFGAGVHCTIGNDADTAAAMEKMGARHQDCPVEDIVIDQRHKLVTTPAYMLARSISEAATGINKLVDEVLILAEA
jgi:enhancing lycopene biosynthesis protein 2